MSEFTIRRLLRTRAVVGGAVIALAATGLVGLLSTERAAPASDPPTTSSVAGADGRTYTVTNHLAKGYRPDQGRHEWLVAWAGDARPGSSTATPKLPPPPGKAKAHHKTAAPAPGSTAKSRRPSDPDFVAVIDATKGSPTYGKVVNTATLSPQLRNEPHHMQYVWHKGQRIYAGGLLSDTTYVFDATRLPELRLTGVNVPTDTSCGSAPDAFSVLRDGTAYASYMGGPDVPGPCRYTNGEVRVGNGYAGSPGEVVRIGPDGRTLAQAPAAPAGGEDPARCHNVPALKPASCANPHGIRVREDLNRMITSDLFEPRDYLDQTRPQLDPFLARDTVRIYDISNRNHPKLVSVSHLPTGPRIEPFPAFKEERMVMENSVTNQPEHRGAFASTMAGGAIFYTPDITDPTPQWREVFDDEAAYRTYKAAGPYGGGDAGSWLQVSPDDRYLFHAVAGHDPRDPRHISSEMVYVLDISKLLASGNQPQCRIDQIAEVSRGGAERDCPAVVDVLPIRDVTTGGPHWGAIDNFERGADGYYHETQQVRRLAVTNYIVERFGMDGDHRACMVDFDGGRLSVDTSFRDEVNGAPCIDFDRKVWPHGVTGSAKPHGVLFVVADDDVR